VSRSNGSIEFGLFAKHFKLYQVISKNIDLLNKLIYIIFRFEDFHFVSMGWQLLKAVPMVCTGIRD
jgi:hypothetical protein